MLQEKLPSGSLLFTFFIPTSLTLDISSISAFFEHSTANQSYAFLSLQSASGSSFFFIHLANMTRMISIPSTNDSKKNCNKKSPIGLWSSWLITALMRNSCPNWTFRLSRSSYHFQNKLANLPAAYTQTDRITPSLLVFFIYRFIKWWKMWFIIETIFITKE